MVWDVVGLALAIPVFSLAFAHALEWPGKARLAPTDYSTVQGIFVPGFTIVGMLTELPALGAVAASVGVYMPSPLRILALMGILAVNLIFWAVVRPVNRQASTARSPHPQGYSAVQARGWHEPDTAWRGLRLRWEVGHCARAACAALTVGCLIATVASR